MRGGAGPVAVARARRAAAGVRGAEPRGAAGLRRELNGRSRAPWRKDGLSTLVGGPASGALVRARSPWALLALALLFTG